MPAPLLTAVRLRRRYRRRTPSLSPWSAPREVTALDGVDLALFPGERLGVVGESGSGKSTLARVLLGLERADSGEVRFGPDGRVVRPDRAGRMRWFRSRAQLVPQDPEGSFDPRIRVGRSVAEPLACLGSGGDHERRVAHLLTSVGLDPRLADRYPRQLSGGQLQRLAIARALAPGPSLLVADEPVSALDVSTQADILRLLRRVSDARERPLALLVISHDLGAVRDLCDRVLVLRAGRVVEHGPVRRVLTRPHHEHTRRLLDAVPRLPDIPSVPSRPVAAAEGAAS